MILRCHDKNGAQSISCQDRSHSLQPHPDDLMLPFQQTVSTLLRMRRLWQAVLLISVAAILYLATTSSSYPIPAAANDKVNHIIAFIELTIVTRLAWPRLSAFWYAPALLGFGLALEAVQANLPYRDFPWPMFWRMPGHCNRHAALAGHPQCRRSGFEKFARLCVRHFLQACKNM